MGAVRSKKISGRSRVLVSLIAVFVVLGIAAFGTTIAVYKFSVIGSEPDTIQIVPSTEPAPNIDPVPENPVKEVNFQPTIDEWVKSLGGEKSVLIYDLDLNKIVGSYNTEEDYSTASLYKLFVVYEGYKRVFEKEWDQNANAGSTGKTIIECLDLAIRESNSACAETLWGIIGRDNLDAIIKEEWKITNSNIPKLISNVTDIALIMKRFYEHPDFNDTTLLNKMWDSFLNQPVTEYDWRQGLPKGFTKATVYNKVGWDFNPDGNYWNIYHDAAIVKFPQDNNTTRDFIVVVMTNRVDFKNIRKFGQMLENKFYDGNF